MTTTKQIIRQQIAKQKATFRCDALKKYSEIICQNLAQSDLFCNAKCVAIYNALKDEVQTEDFINVWYEKKTIALPIVTGNEMEFHLYNAPLQIKIGQFGIKEPLNTRLVKQQDIDLMIVPGVAFDINGNRLGRGRGFYDKYLQYLKIPVIGLCFDFQLLDTIPAEPHDKKMTAIITEKRQIYFAI